MDRYIDQKRQHDQHKTQTKRQSEIAFAGFKRDGGRQHARCIVDVTADDHDRTHLADGAAKSCQRRCQQSAATVADQR